MSILATIRNHSGRLYRGIQLLLVISLCSALFAAIGNSESALSIAAVAVSIAATALSLMTLMYMRRSVVHRLRQAAKVEAENQKLLRTDAVTGAATRRFFLEELQASLGGLHNRKKAALVLVDIDHFKQLNDTLGHQFGDAALAHLVNAARQAYPDCTIGRLGGDEFGVIMPDDDLELVMARTQRLLDALRAGKVHEGNQITLSASIGIAVAPLHSSETKELMLLADLALYDSKAAGRGRMTVFDAEMLSDKRYRRLVERELRAALYLNHLELHYQPITDGAGATVALEGLVRWRHPVRGMISPAEFIPIAERSNLIDMLGEWVFRRACADIAAFAGCRISINMSGEQLKRDEIVAMLGRVLAETDRTADRFVIEITETVATAATPETLKRLDAIRAMGFRIALDDFGTGHCGFNYLKTLPTDGIKIDRSYVRSLASDPVAQVFVSALAQIARIQNLTIVAEGVETAEEFALARAAGCNRFQGYFISRPLPRERLGSLSFDLDAPQLALSA
jgi:diguanylate cyclase (GGDEF)-like protein